MDNAGFHPAMDPRLWDKPWPDRSLLFVCLTLEVGFSL